MAEATTAQTPPPASLRASPRAIAWEMRLYRRSIKKKETLRAVLRLLPPLEGKRCLELGWSGAASRLLRRRGGAWVCAGLDRGAVEVGEELGGDEVHPIQAGTLPFAGGSFDVVVAIHFIRSVEDDRSFVREIARVLAPGGCLVFTCPEGATRRPGYRLKRLYRLTFDTGGFGEVRDGYLRSEIEELVRGAGLELERLESYSRIFTEVVENSLQFAYHRAVSDSVGPDGGAPAERWPSASRHVRSTGWKYRAYQAAYPLLRGFSLLDRFVPFSAGYMFCVRARRPAASR